MHEVLRLVPAVVVGAVLLGAALVLGPLVGFEVSGPALAVTTVLASVVVWFVYDSIERVDPPGWPAPATPRELPALPSEVRARRLQSMVQGALENRQVSAIDLGPVLADLVADRLVAHHDADPHDPLRDVATHVSPEFAHYLRQSLDGRPPRIRRSTLHAYLEEIDAL